MNRTMRLAIALSAVGLVLGGSVRAEGKKEETPNDPHAVLIGKSAPEVAADHCLSGKAVKLAELKGKVVLVHFWAVWCGPCVATFPHLRDLNKEYKDKGLEIIGLTSYYERFGFDKGTAGSNNGKLKRADNVLTKAQEHEVLKEFATYHRLDHRLMVLNKDDIGKIYKEYGVKGIPQVVLIDRKGNVRMIKVGSGEENAKAIDEMIKTLIAEK
jgi:thiol-disulfide isomerase/thioredoxin